MSCETNWKTKDGRPIHMEWEEDIEQENRGWVTHRMKAIVDEKEVGYLKASYIPSYNVSRYYPDVTWFLAQIHGCWELNSDDPIRRLVALSEKIDPWHNWLSQEDVRKMSPQERMERTIEYIQALEKKYRRQFNEHLNYFVDKPYVYFVAVDDSFQRLGIGMALYEATAYKLAEKGLRLYGSTLQSKDAEAVWRRMEFDSRLSLLMGQEKIKHNGRLWIRRYLDLTPLLRESQSIVVERAAASRASTKKTKR